MTLLQLLALPVLIYGITKIYLVGNDEFEDKARTNERFNINREN